MNISESKPLFPIRTAAKILNLSVQTLRLYEAEGLIVIKKSETNQRIYSKSDLERIQRIRDILNTKHVSICGYKAILSLTPCWKLKNCQQNIRENCQAFTNPFQACWTQSVQGSEDACRKCEVYNNYLSVHEIKKLINDISGN